ncbi:MAG: DUF4199 domain-containing protein [Prevotellaceae bacterium]|nr:DUF4199 domain-containing protein [Prevotellaceae bacterium]
MATREEYEQLKAFARIDGAIVGGLWILSFACFIGEFYNPFLGILAFVIGAGSLVFAALRLKKFRDNILEGVISFRRAFGYSIFTYFYAALLMALAQYVYFQFIDNGFLISRYMEMASMPEFKSMMQIYGLRPDDVQVAMDNIKALRPIDIALQFLTTNIILGIVVSLPMAAMIKSNYRRKF